MSYYLGAFSSNGEYSVSSYTNVSLSLVIDYSIPPAQVNITAKNNFIYGTIKVGLNASATQRTSPYPFTATVGNTVNLEAQEQNYGDYNWIWNDTEAPANPSNWLKYVNGIPSQVNTSIVHSFTTADNDGNSTYEAGLRKVCNLEFISSGSIYVDGEFYSSPRIRPVVELNTVYAYASSYSSVGIDYTFSYWDNSPTSNTITATAHGTYTAVFTAKPNIVNRSQQITSGIGDLIVISWNAHPNQYVTQYRVYRKVGKTGTPDLLTTTSNTTFTDPEYTMTGNSEDTYIMYDVRPVYSVNQTESNPYFQSAAFGIIEASTIGDNLVAALSNELPKEYSIGNYPNPFNPITTINYQLPENGFVTIKVYDLLGKEMATLVDGNRNAGYHNVSFDASRLTSGIYIYTINTNTFAQSKKMLLVK